MKKNLGKFDKIVRVVFGIVVIIAGAYFKSVWGVLGIIPIITSELGICHVYSIIGINTIPKKIEIGGHK